jgi:hypothetical protein
MTVEDGLRWLTYRKDWAELSAFIYFARHSPPREEKMSLFILPRKSITKRGKMRL